MIAAATLHRHTTGIMRDGVEIERKYLLSGMPRARWTARYHIRQGYIPGDRIRERVRAIRGADGTRYVRTFKGGHGLVRTEIEEETTETIFRGLWRLTKGHRIRKWRYVAEHAGFTWEVDRFVGIPLVLAEVELPHEHAVAPLPPWLERVLVREVTGDCTYSNSTLAR